MYPYIDYSLSRAAADREKAEAMKPQAETTAPADKPAAKERTWCDFPHCDCSMGAAERCSHPPHGAKP